MDLFDRFTDRAKKVVLLAKEEAIRLNHNYIGTEHLLLGLIKEGSGIAAAALVNMGLDLETIKTEIEKVLQYSSNTMVIGDIVFTPRAKKVLQLAIDEAREMGQDFIGTEHLLLALLHEKDGIAANVLNMIGITLEKVREQIFELLEEGGVKPTGQHQTHSKTRTPTLDQFGRDLTALAKANKLDPIIGRINEIERVIQILSRRTKNNPVLIGDPGVGKTAIVEGLAQKIVEQKVPEILYNKRVLTLELASIVAGTKYRGQFEERMKVVMNEIRHSPDVILFIDELHTLVGTGSAEGALDASSILKPALSRGEMQCIGATTLEDYRKYIEKDGALERRFQTVMVNEPTVEETILILKGLRDKYEAHHKVKYLDSALEAAAKLSDKYITGRYLPDKAIDLMDEAGAKVKLSVGTTPDELKKIETEIQEINREKEEAIKEQDFEKAAKLRDKHNKLKKKLSDIKKEWDEKKIKLELTVIEEDIAEIVSKWTGIPVIKLEEKEIEKLLRMPEELHKRIIGQDEAIDALSRAIQRSRAGLKDPKRPIGSFIFAGPTGVGKSELCKVLAEFLFGDQDALVQIDMSEYMEKFAVSRLVGAPPGYIGHDEAGQLTEKIRRRPYSVVLLDDIDKAHPDVFDMMLQVLEEGRLTDATGRVVNFRNTVVIMTTNIGMDKSTITGFGISEDKLSYEGIKKKVQDGLKERFKAEFRNRIDEIIIFYPLTKPQIRQIVDLLIKQVQERLKEKNIEIELTPEAKELLIEKGYDPQFGARPMRRTIQRYIEDALSEEILKGKIKEGKIVVKRIDDSFVFEEE